jgi:hypothetical protein
LRQPAALRPDAPGVRVDIDENLIRAVVLAFYARIRADESVGLYLQWRDYRLVGASRQALRVLVVGDSDERRLQGAAAPVIGATAQWVEGASPAAA